MAELQITSTLPLKSGHKIPILGFGTCASATCTQSALDALQSSYTHLDTAQIYKNEAETGAALAQSQIDPSTLFVCSKLWEDMYTRAGALAGVEESLKKLGLQSIDLYLLHTPRPGREARKEAVLIGVSCGGAHTAAVAEDGSAFLWGLNDSGQLVQGSDSPYLQVQWAP